MAWKIERAGRKIIQLFNKHDISIDNQAKQQLKDLGYTNIGGYNCLIANVIGLSSFRVRVNRKWFRPNKSEDLKPTLTNTREEFDFQLLPTKNFLYALYYRALKDYALLLESDKKKWFNEPRWGMEVNDNKGCFVWKGGNTRQFPLTPIQSIQAFSIREKQYLFKN